MIPEGSDLPHCVLTASPPFGPLVRQPVPLQPLRRADTAPAPPGAFEGPAAEARARRRRGPAAIANRWGHRLREAAHHARQHGEAALGTSLVSASSRSSLPGHDLVQGHEFRCEESSPRSTPGSKSALTLPPAAKDGHRRQWFAPSVATSSSSVSPRSIWARAGKSSGQGVSFKQEHILGSVDSFCDVDASMDSLAEEEAEDRRLHAVRQILQGQDLRQNSLARKDNVSEGDSVEVVSHSSRESVESLPDDDALAGESFEDIADASVRAFQQLHPDANVARATQDEEDVDVEPGPDWTWQISTEDGWVNWVPGDEEFHGRPGEKVNYVIGRWKYAATFSSWVEGVQENLDTHTLRPLRCTPPANAAPRTADGQPASLGGASTSADEGESHHFRSSLLPSPGDVMTLIVKDLTKGTATKVDLRSESTTSLHQALGGIQRDISALDPSSLSTVSGQRVWGGFWEEKLQTDARVLKSAAENLKELKVALAESAAGAATRFQGRTPLHAAAEAGRADCVEFLLNNRADIAAFTDTGFTAFHLACRNGRVAVAKLLIDRGVDAFVETKEPDDDEPDEEGADEPSRLSIWRAATARTTDRGFPLHLAAMSGSTELLAMVLSFVGEEQLLSRNALGQLPADAAADFAACEYLAHRTRQLAASRTSASARPRDSYAGRAMLDEVIFEDGSLTRVEVLLRNSREDFVRKTLWRRQCREDAGPKQLPKASWEAGAAPGCSFGCQILTQRRPRHVRTPSTGTSDGGVKSGPFSRLRPEGSAVTGAVPSDFEPVKDLGQGGFGVVIQVQHRRTQKMYAMKMYDKGQMLDKNMLKYVLHERHILTYVKHPYIVRLHWAIQTDRHLMLILQLGSGTLKERVKREARRKLEEPLARVFTGEVLLALSYLHERKIVYRDLKPENVVMDDEGHVLLIDFGLSKQVLSNSTSTFIGTTAYMAPEMLDRVPKHGASVDIYGLGVILHFMLMGWEPFLEPSRKGQDQTTIMRRIKLETLVIPEEISPSGRSLIEQLMKKEPADRPVAQEVKEHEFFQGRPCNIGANWEALAQREVWLPDEGDDAPAPVPSTPPIAAKTQPRTPRSGGGRPEPPTPVAIGRGVKQFERTVTSTDDKLGVLPSWDWANTDDVPALPDLPQEVSYTSASLASIHGSALSRPATPVPQEKGSAPLLASGVRDLFAH